MLVYKTVHSKLVYNLFQSQSSTNVIKNWRFWKHQLGTLWMSDFSLDHCLLLHLEICQGYWKGCLLHCPVSLCSTHWILDQRLHSSRGNWWHQVLYWATMGENVGIKGIAILLNTLYFFTCQNTFELACITSQLTMWYYILALAKLISRTPWFCGLIHQVLDREVRSSNLAVDRIFSSLFIRRRGGEEERRRGNAWAKFKSSIFFT